MFNYTLKEAIILPSVLAAFIILGIILRLTLKTEKSKKIVFIIIGAALLALEIAKQIYCSIATDYDYWKLPLHFCSLYVVLYPLAHWFGEKCSKIFKPVAFVYSVMGTVLLYAFPHVLLGDTTQNIFGSFVNFHGFVFHNIISLYLVLSICLNDYIARPKDCINCGVGILFYASYAIPCAFKLQVNYVNILYSTIDFIDKFRLRVGYPIYLTCLILAGILASCMIVMLVWFIQNLINKKTNKSTK